ncbi:hypothetical protein ACTFIZ_001758 [Dictyostelium cf. discoideum]
MPMVNRKIQPKKPEKLIDDFLNQNVFYFNHYYEDFRGVEKNKKIIFTAELLLLKQIDAAKVLNITTKSILKLLKQAIEEIETLSEYYNNYAAKVLNITTKSILKLLKHAINEIDTLSKYYNNNYGGVENYKEIIFTAELLLLKQTDAAKVLNITTKSILKLLKHAINEIDTLSEYYNNSKRKIIWPHRCVTSPLMLYVYANKSISVKCVFKNEK